MEKGKKKERKTEINNKFSSRTLTCFKEVLAAAFS
jgi:hypothetical protein